MMTCEECHTTDNSTLYCHAVTNKRYCPKCWSRLGTHGPIPIDRCSDAVKNAAAMAGGVVWKPSSVRQAERTVIVDGAPVKCDTTTELNRAIEEAQKALVIVPSATPPRQKPELQKCALCSTVSNDGAWLDSNIYWCGTCLADIEESGEMKTKHIKLKLRGSDKAIAFFHYVCTQIDNDWPWNPKKVEPTPCPKCGGVLYVAAVLEAEEIRTIAQQSGVGKCKIPFFSEAKVCFGR